MRTFRWVGVVMCLLLLSSAAAYAQGGQQQAPPTVEQRIIRSFTNVMTKLVNMAKDLPDEKLEYRPHPDSRSALEEFWHITAANQAMAMRARGEQVSRSLFANEGRPRDRATLVADLEKSVADCIAAMEKDPAVAHSAVGTLEHAGEHYGKLVTAYRVNGLVPPASRR